MPSATFTSFSTPLAGAGISASTLSVEISNSGSSRVTLSPGFFSHLVSVPSKIDSPIWGMMTSVGMCILSARQPTKRNQPFYRNHSSPHFALRARLYSSPRLRVTVSLRNPSGAQSCNSI